MSQLKLSSQLISQMHQLLIQHDENAEDPGVASQYMCAMVGCLLGELDKPAAQKEEILESLRIPGEIMGGLHFLAMWQMTLRNKCTQRRRKRKSGSGSPA